MYYTIFAKAGFAALLSTMLLHAEYGDYSSNDDPPAHAYYEPPKSIPAKQVIIQNRKTITALKRRVSELEERMAGLTSLLEGQNATIAEMKMVNSMGAQNSSGTDNTALIKELGVMIDKINTSYVSKEELQKILGGKKISASKPKINKQETNESLEGRSTAKIYSEGVRLFIKQRYDEAEKRFTITDTKGYKPAASNYYLGEIAYYTKKYEDAIFFYKKSVSLYDQASYIDVLLLHTAISLEKTGDKAQAKTFYRNIIDNYPDKKSAKIAKEKLKKLK
jgi:TolA-binding protein